MSDASREHYNRLMAQRRALEQLVQVTESLERLQSGLQAVVLMGEEVSSVSQSALRFFQGLSATTRDQPSERLRQALAALEGRVQNTIARIVAVADHEPSDTAGFDDESTRLITEFKRSSQTAVALRVLLKERGEVTDACALPVSQVLLKEKAAQVAAKEQHYRGEVENGIQKALDTTRAMLADPSVSGVVRAALKSSIGQLERELAHVRAGRSMEGFADAAPAGDTPLPPAADGQAPAEPAGDVAKREGRRAGGLLSQFMEWLNSPWHVGWKDIRRRRSPP